MTLRLNGATSGYTEIAAPAAAGNNTLSLPTSNGSDGQALVTNGSGTLSFADRGRMVLETAKAYNWNSLTTNTSLDFTSIPSWVKRVTVMFNGVSTNGTSLIVVRLGTSGGVVASGYTGAASSVGATVITQQWASGFGLRGSTTTAADIYEGHMLLSLIDSSDWISSHTMALSNAPVTLFGAGSVSLGGTLDQVRITTTGGVNTFDAGTINLLLEG
jgi:hypothetical protein